MKTITIDLEAYEALARNKKKGQSFSQVIKEHFVRRGTGEEVLAALKSIEFSTTTLDVIEDMLNQRSEDQPRALDL